jgi:hypothetical protein
LKEINSPENENPETEKVEQDVEKQRNEVKEENINEIESSLEPKDFPEECKTADGLYVRDSRYLDDNHFVKWEEYAPNGGFEGETTMTTLKEGDVVQRYGDTNGTYVAPEGTKYEELSMPYEKESIGEPKTYVVKKDIDDVESGKIAPAFDQDGGGTQYILPDTIDQLEKEKYLEEV